MLGEISMSFERIDCGLEEVALLAPRVFADSRGFFFESYHFAKFATHGISDVFVQDNHSRSVHGVLRGLHYQTDAAPMAKLVRCTAGRVLDVAVDLRVGSPTFGRHVAAELSEQNRHMLYVPVGFAHGFLVLSETADVLYKCSAHYAPEHEGVIRWDDPDLAIPWPIAQCIVSGRDANAPSLAQYLANPAFRAPVGSTARHG
jgi:dTDP-4-dehydrorhamnose 3,5-epimerase